MTEGAESWKPTASMAVLHQRADMLREARAFFAERKVLEVETPALAVAGVTDPNLSNVSCRLAMDPDREFYLQTSPEYAMKRLLAAGSPDIYQICKVFRNHELGSQHQPEFTLIEWYRRNFTMQEMADETCALIQSLHHAASAGAGEDRSVARFRYRDVFVERTGLDPLLAGIEELRHCAGELTDLVTQELIAGLGSDRSAWLDFLMSYIVIPRLPDDRLIVVHHYPAEQAALARLDPADGRFAERFEVFFQGLELANGYRELLDPEEQRRRFESDLARRSAADRAVTPIDTALLAALEHGLPDCCGVAVGLDRVIMSTGSAQKITDAISFALHGSR